MTSNLVCAPCWICLEDGPDDNGAPLVRDCSCRGETSAGYHLSCIIDYAKVKTNKAIDLLDRKHKTVKNFHEPWKRCPNCQQPYMGIVSLHLAEALMEHTNHLPESHFVRFRARCLYLDSLSLFNRDSHSAEIQAKAILQTLEENPSELAVSLLGEASAGDQLIEVVVAGESVKPLVALGTVKKKMGDVESAVVLFEKALEYLDAAEASGFCPIDHAQRDFIESHIRRTKREMGLISPSEEVAELRKSLNRMAQEGRDGLLIANAKQQLAIALKKMDPPQYFEAIKLLKECSVFVFQVFGPENQRSTLTKDLYDKTRKEYMLYLRDIAKKGN